jgi:hypothetical protein
VRISASCYAVTVVTGVRTGNSAPRLPLQNDKEHQMSINNDIMKSLQPEFEAELVGKLRALREMITSGLIPASTIARAMLMVGTETALMCPDRRTLLNDLKNAVAIIDADDHAGSA